jgi:hypothetical protein
MQLVRLDAAPKPDIAHLLAQVRHSHRHQLPVIAALRRDEQPDLLSGYASRLPFDQQAENFRLALRQSQDHLAV